MTPELREACARSAHVITREGVVLNAGRGTLFILRQLGWGWTWLLSVPPLIWLVELGYAIFARNRVFFFRFLSRFLSRFVSSHDVDR